MRLTKVFQVISTDSILIERVASIFTLPTNMFRTVVTAIIGGLAGGFGGLTGSTLRNWVRPQN